jgi:hypothetical protein
MAAFVHAEGIFLLTFLVVHAVSPQAMGLGFVPLTQVHLGGLFFVLMLRGIVSPTSYCIVARFPAVVHRLIGLGPLVFPSRQSRDHIMGSALRITLATCFVNLSLGGANNL